MEGILERQKAKLKRAAKLMQVLSKYGFEDLKAKIDSSKGTDNKETDLQSTQDTAFYQRIRKAIEELGPTYIKFGQTLSTREDLFPSPLIVEFKKLQDDVKPDDIDLIALLEKELQISVSDFFSEIDDTPLASASIAQTYKAKLQNGEQVILKIKRQGIKDVVNADLLLMRDIIDVLSSYYSIVREINLKHVFEAFAKSLLEELSFNNELKNIQIFERNFRGTPNILTMKGYPELSNDNVLCISFVEGTKINDKKIITDWSLNPEVVLDHCFELYLTQLLDHGFFHADPHPGNILVTPQGQIAFLDLGAVAKMSPKDKELLEDFVVYFIYKDAARLVSTLKKMAIHADIKSEKSLQRAIEELLDIIDSHSLEELDIKSLFSKFSHLLNENNVIMPEHIYLLVKGIVLMEGIGRELAPDINIIEKIKPYIQKIASQRIDPTKLLQDNVSTFWEVKRLLATAPQHVGSLFDKLNGESLKIDVVCRELDRYRKQKQRSDSLNRMLFTAATTFIGGCLLADTSQISFAGVSIISWVLFLVSTLVIIIMLLKKYKLQD